MRIGVTSDLELEPTDLNIDRDQLLNKTWQKTMKYVGWTKFQQQLSISIREKLG